MRGGGRESISAISSVFLYRESEKYARQLRLSQLVLSKIVANTSSNHWSFLTNIQLVDGVKKALIPDYTLIQLMGLFQMYLPLKIDSSPICLSRPSGKLLI